MTPKVANTKARELADLAGVGIRKRKQGGNLHLWVLFVPSYFYKDSWGDFPEAQVHECVFGLDKAELAGQQAERYLRARFTDAIKMLWDIATSDIRNKNMEVLARAEFEEFNAKYKKPRTKNQER